MLVFLSLQFFYEAYHLFVVPYTRVLARVCLVVVGGDLSDDDDLIVAVSGGLCCDDFGVCALGLLLGEANRSLNRSFSFSCCFCFVFPNPPPFEAARVGR